MRHMAATRSGIIPCGMVPKSSKSFQRFRASWRRLRECLSGLYRFYAWVLGVLPERLYTNGNKV